MAEMATILAAVQAQGQAIQSLLQNYTTQQQQRTTTETAPTVVSHNIVLDQFDPEEEDFSSYKERLDNFLTMRNIGNTPEDEIAKRSILLGCLKRVQFKQLASLTTPDKPSEKTYADLLKILEKSYDPITNVHTERHRFLSRIQGKSESLTSYIASLKLISQKCHWVCPENTCKKPIEAIFQAQFISGVRDKYIREKILVMDANTSLDKTLETALGTEAAHKQNAEEYNTSSSGTVNKISFRPSRSKERFYKNNNNT